MFDGWSVWFYDMDEGGQQKIVVYNILMLWNGIDGLLGCMEEFFFEYVGDEMLEVLVGCYLCWYFMIDFEVLDVFVLYIWVYGDDCLFVCYSWFGFDFEYVLVEYYC